MRIAAVVAAAALPFAAAVARAGEEPASPTDRRLEEVLKEMERQRAEIESLKARLAVEDGTGGVADAVKQYLESEEGKKALGASKTDFRVSWKDGLAFETADKAFSLKVGGRVHYDVVLPDADDDVEALRGDIDRTAGLRRARVEFSGTIYENVFYANAIEFSGSATTFKNNFIGLKGLPGGTQFQVGFFKEPVGLEELTSSNVITFVERSLATNAFAPNFNNGFMVSGSHHEDRLNWAIGDFQDNASQGPAPVSFQHNFSGRVCGLPWQDKEKGSLLHVGASIQDRSPETENDRIQVRPSVPFIVRTQDTGVFGVDSELILGLEAAFVRGPFCVQGEWFKAEFEDHPDAPGASPSYGGYYAMVSYWITGETRPYKGGAFGRVKPKSVFTRKDGTGALELAARYSALDLDDDGLDGGVGHDLTLGANWHLNPNCRVMVNYVLYTRTHVGDVNSLVFRFQVDF
jgi:phosphate-selective porin OprO/OprP